MSHTRDKRRRIVAAPIIAVTAAFLTACSVQRYAINSFAEILASGGTVFESDNDPVLVGEALPFSLKLMEGLLAEQPDNEGLLLATCRGYLLYTYGFVHVPAEQRSMDSIAEARALRARARNLYLRAHGYARRALQNRYPGIGGDLSQDPEAALRAVAQHDVAMLYWDGAALALAISVSRNEAALLARIPEVEALLARALELDETWNAGALHEFAIVLAAARSTSAEQTELRTHYDRALELSEGARASVYVSYAEATAVPAQDRSQFVELLRRALEVDIELDPENRLLNVIAQQRASWLLERVDELFL